MIVIDKLKEFTGKAYRVDVENWGIPREATAADVVWFEQEELGNVMGVSKEVLEQLEQYRHTDVVWVTKRKADAEYYLSEDMTKEDISTVSLPEGSLIVADDKQGGYLVLKGNAKPIGNLDVSRTYPASSKRTVVKRTRRISGKRRPEITMGSMR